MTEEQRGDAPQIRGFATEGKPVGALDQGLAQLDAYLERLGLAQGTLVLFDRRTDAVPLGERIAFTQAQTPAGRAARILRA